MKKFLVLPLLGSIAITASRILAAEVTNTDDGGPGSLRQTVLAAAPGDTITFAPSLSGLTITLATPVTLDKNLTLNASALADGITVSGNDVTRVFLVTSGTTVAMSSLTVSSGKAVDGGGILNNGVLSLTQCSIDGNAADGYGGGIYNTSTGTLTLNRCTCAGNNSDGTVFGGGGISNDGILEVNQSTFTGNLAAAGGGAIDSYITLTVKQSTFTKNSAATVGGGISSTVPVEMSNTIVAGNFAGNFAGPFTGSDNFTTGDPRLAPLGDFGGPTPTMPPLPGSPVIEAATASDFTTDQRTAPRITGPLPDIGAVEAFPFSTLTRVDSDSDGIDDRLELAYPQLTVGVNDSALDTDGDGSSDAEELNNMTNPNDGTDYFRILSFAPAEDFDPDSNPLFDISFKTFPGLRYELEESQALGAFTPVPASRVTAAGPIRETQVLLSPGRGFVRARRGFTDVRWASSVIGFSTEYTTGAWSAAQALGPPDTYPSYGDIDSAWASLLPDDTEEFLELGFSNPAPISAVSIYETFAPGAVSKVSVRNSQTLAWVEVWNGTAAAAPPVSRIFTVTFPETSFPVDAVRIVLDSPAVADWNEIDAVGILRVSP